MQAPQLQMIQQNSPASQSLLHMPKQQTVLPQNTLNKLNGGMTNNNQKLQQIMSNPKETSIRGFQPRGIIGVPNPFYQPDPSLLGKRTRENEDNEEIKELTRATPPPNLRQSMVSLGPAQRPLL